MRITGALFVLSCVALLSACGQQDASSAQAPGATAAAPAQPHAGQGVYNRTCAMCHTAGVAGAPKPGDKEDWAPRIAQGIEVLYAHSIDGFTGEKGFMPARGGASISDDEVKAAVDFMVAQSQ